MTKALITKIKEEFSEEAAKKRREKLIDRMFNQVKCDPQVIYGIGYWLKPQEES